MRKFSDLPEGRNKAMLSYSQCYQPTELGIKGFWGTLLPIKKQWSVKDSSLDKLGHGNAKSLVLVSVLPHKVVNFYEQFAKKLVVMAGSLFIYLDEIYIILCTLYNHLFGFFSVVFYTIILAQPIPLATACSHLLTPVCSSQYFCFNGFI